MEKSTIIAKLLPVNGAIKIGSKVVHKDLSPMDGPYETVKELRDGIVTIDCFEEEEYSVENLLPVEMCAVETNFKAPCKVVALTNHAFAEFGKRYKLTEEKQRGRDNTVVIVKGFEEIGDHYKKAKADDLRKPLWMKKEVFGINLGEISEKAKWVTDGMPINIEMQNNTFTAPSPILNDQGKISVMCDNCESYH